jgi:hypothetical protein
MQGSASAILANFGYSANLHPPGLFPQVRVQSIRALWTQAFMAHELLHQHLFIATKFFAKKRQDSGDKRLKWESRVWEMGSCKRSF